MHSKVAKDRDTSLKTISTGIRTSLKISVRSKKSPHIGDAQTHHCNSKDKTHDLIHTYCRFCNQIKSTCENKETNSLKAPNIMLLVPLHSSVPLVLHSHRILHDTSKLLRCNMLQNAPTKPVTRGMQNTGSCSLKERSPCQSHVVG